MTPVPRGGRLATVAACLRRRIGPGAAGALVALLPILPPPALASVLQFNVSSSAALRTGTTVPVAPIAPGFVGASIDYCAISRYNPGTTADPVLVSLLSALAPEGPVLRVGGPGPESGCPTAGNGSIYFATPAVKAISQALNAALILGVNLESGRADWARFQVATLLRGIDPGPRYRYVRAFEIGNEPDLLPRYGAYMHATKVIGWFMQYLRDFNYWSRIVRRVSGRGFGIAGPSLGDATMNWVSGGRVRNLTKLLYSAARPHYVTFHRYPLLGPISCPSPGCPAIDQLLADSSSHGLAATLVPLIARVPRDRVIRVDEMNSVTGGGRAGVSDTFASALWALDTCFELAQAGVQGVNFHTFTTAAYALFSGPQGGWSVHPEYYGLLTFAHAAPAGSQLLSVTPQPASSGGPNVKVWATHGADGKTRFTLLNKDTQDFDFQLSGSALPADGTAALERLSAPATLSAPGCPSAYVSSGVCATSGVTLGGQTFGAVAGGGSGGGGGSGAGGGGSGGGGGGGGSGGGDLTTTGTLPPAQSIGPCNPLLLSQACDQPIFGGLTTVAVPAGSAVLLTVG